MNDLEMENVNRLIRYMEQNDLPPSYVMQRALMAAYDWLDIIDGRAVYSRPAMVAIEDELVESVSAGHGPSDLLALLRNWQRF